MPRTELFASFRRALRAADQFEREGIATSVAIDREAEAWSRRRFMQTSAAAAAGAAFLPVIGNAQEKPRVVILGAGMAGLTCAYRLQQAGIASTIVEASPRVGGRMYSLQNFFPDNQVAELGGELIDTDHHAIRNLAKELDVELIDLTYRDVVATLIAGALRLRLPCALRRPSRPAPGSRRARPIPRRRS